MKKAGILVAVGIITLLLVACGGGGGGGTPVGGQTPTAASATPTAVVSEGELIRLTVTAGYTLEPQIVDLKVGKAYKVQFLNRGEQGLRLRIPRWDIRLFAGAGLDSQASAPFVPDTAGDFDCFEELTASLRGMKCIVRVSQ